MWFFTCHHFIHYQVAKWFEKTRLNQPICWHCHDSLCFYQNKTWSPHGYVRLVCQDKTWTGCSEMLWWLVQGELIAFLFPSHCFITLLALPLSGSYVRVGNRFRSQVQDKKVGGSPKKSMFHPYKDFFSLRCNRSPWVLGRKWSGWREILS